MELRDLRALVAVLRSGSFTAAAVELGYTQSAVSQQVAALEAEVGHRLVDRRPVRATPAGARMAEHAIRILLRVDVARSELNAASTAVELLRIVACPQAVPGILPGAVRALRRDHPALAVAIRSVDTATAVARLAAGHADVALIDGIAAPDSPLLVTETGLVASTTVAEEPLVVAFPLGHPLAGRRAVDLQMLVDAPWIVTPGLPTTVALHGPLTYDGGDPALLLGLVASGHGCALLPAPRAAPDGVVGVPLRSPRLVHRVEMLTLRSLGGPIEVLGSELRAALGMLRTAPS